MTLRFFDADAVARLPITAAIVAIEEALVQGLDPEADPPRQVVPTTHGGHLLVMPASTPQATGVKIASVAPDNPARGLPRIQGAYVLFDAATLAPVAVLDAAALTTLRTPAVSAVAIARLAVGDARRLLVFGTGPQAYGHVLAARAVRPIESVEVVGRTPAGVAAFIARCQAEGIAAHAASADAVDKADVIVCCTSARTPLFDGDRVAPHATLVAVGSHEADAREVDAALCARATVVVEARTAALREAGDVIMAIAAGALTADRLVTLAELVRRVQAAAPSRPRLYKSVGMAWQDAVVAAAVYGLKS